MHFLPHLPLFFLLSSPSSAAHHLPPLTARPPAPSSLVARAYHIPPLTARPHTPSSLLARPNPLPRWLVGTENPSHFALKNLMAEPTDTQSRDWNSLPDVLLEQICSRMDLLSTVRLATCSVSLYRLLICNRPALFKTPCLLMPDLTGGPDTDLTILRRFPWCPSTCYHYPSTCPSCAATTRRA